MKARNFPFNYAGSGHVNRLCFEQNCCVLVRRTPINYILFRCSIVVVGKRLREVCFFRQIFRILNEHK